jgi:lysophospholipase L1-like esterase
VNVAVPGDTIAQQKADWNSLPVNSLGTAWVVLQVGLNDLNPSVGTTASKIAEIQDLVDTIKADIGSKPLYVAKMLPCKQRLVDVYGANAALSQQRWVDMNEAIAGNGSSPITGVQGRIVSHVPLMDDGLGNLKAVYDLGDHIHPNTAGRQVMATAWEGFTT